MAANAPARAFYQRLGAANAGTVDLEDPGGGRAPNCRYVWAEPRLLMTPHVERQLVQSLESFLLNNDRTDGPVPLDERCRASTTSRCGWHRIRHAWYALPMVMLAFVVLAVVPVMLLIAATGIAFGPVLGPIYAMAGCLASGSVGFAIGRWMGLTARAATRRHAHRPHHLHAEAQRHARRLPPAQSARALPARQHRRRRIERALSRFPDRHDPRHGRRSSLPSLASVIS